MKERSCRKEVSQPRIFPERPKEIVRIQIFISVTSGTVRAVNGNRWLIFFFITGLCKRDSVRNFRSKIMPVLLIGQRVFKASFYYSVLYCMDVMENYICL